MKVNLDVSKLVGVDAALTTKLEELESENRAFRSKIKKLEEKICTLTWETEENNRYKIEYNNLKEKIRDFLKLGEE